MVAFNRELRQEKAQYQVNLNSELKQYLSKQHLLLGRLQKTILPALQQRDFARVAANIAAFEDLNFALASENLAVPLSIHLVSLDAPRYIIGAAGSSTDAVLVNEDAYYLSMLEQPERLQVSQIYISPEMPDYQLVNLGVGMLDARLAINDLHNYLATRMHTDIFTFSFNQKLQDIQISIPLVQYMQGLCTYLGFRAVIAALSLGILYLCLSLLTANRQRLQVSRQLADLRAELDLQNRYAQRMQAKEDLQIIEMQQLLVDVKILNARLAADKGIELIFPAYDRRNLRLYKQQFRLLQILSGITYEMIRQSTQAGRIELHFMLSEISAQQHKLVFTFSDNGFYETLEDTGWHVASTELPYKGWGNILALVALEGAHIEHKHTVYQGNTIVLTVYKTLLNNVIKLESFCH